MAFALREGAEERLDSRSKPGVVSMLVRWSRALKSLRRRPVKGFYDPKEEREFLRNLESSKPEETWANWW